MDEMQKTHYLAKDGLICPYCLSSDIEELGTSHHSHQQRKVKCHNCNKRWQDVYALVDVLEDEE